MSKTISNTLYALSIVVSLLFLAAGGAAIFPPSGTDPAPVGAPVLVLRGHPRVVDGDTLAYGDLRVRFGGGVDAFELHQDCIVGGRRERCGQIASSVLTGTIDGQVVTCVGDGETDKRGRPIARCSVPGVEDLGAKLVRAGWAVVDERFGDGYLPLQGAAYHSGAGAWARPWAFEEPRAWRDRGKRAEAGR